MNKIVNGQLVEMTPEEIADWEAEQAVNAPTLADAIAAKLAALDAYRWEREIGGVDFGGLTIRTDQNSQAKITAAYAMAKLDPAYEIPVWEAVPGTFIALSNAQLVAIGEAVRDHIQATFTRKAALHAQISALETVEAVEAFDIATEWDD